MTRLIDADALSEKLCETTIFIKDGEVFQRMINDAPTVDAVEVVRCKDCKYTKTDGMEQPAIYCEKWDRWEMPEDFFCAYGYRKGGDDE